MKRKPNDISDYSQCVIYYCDSLYVFCVECDDWKKVMISCNATVLYRQAFLHARVSDCFDLQYLCGKCQCDIAYLLSSNQKQILIKSLDIPLGETHV